MLSKDIHHALHEKNQFQMNTKNICVNELIHACMCPRLAAAVTACWTACAFPDTVSLLWCCCGSVGFSAPQSWPSKMLMISAWPFSAAWTSAHWPFLSACPTWYRDCTEGLNTTGSGWCLQYSGLDQECLRHLSPRIDSKTVMSVKPRLERIWLRRNIEKYSGTDWNVIYPWYLCLCHPLRTQKPFTSVLFCTETTLTLAPFLQNRLTILVCPAAAARHKGVMPLSVVPSTGAHISSSRATISAWPRWVCTAKMGACPTTSVHQETLAPPSINRRLTCRGKRMNVIFICKSF